ncbi:MAG: GIY-YIG nuclease family protein [Candidatus Methylomirabilota bacterium]
MIGRIYKITNDVNSKIYIGSTMLSLKQRMYRHKASLNCGTTTLLYKEMRNVGGIDHFKIEEIETIENCDKKQLKRLEGTHIMEIHNTLGHDLSLNKNIAGRKFNEYMRYYMTNSEHHKQHLQYERANYERNKVEIIKKAKKYYLKNKDKILSNQKQRYRKLKIQQQTTDDIVTLD